MSEARGSPEKKRRHNHESPERGKQQEEIVCGHVRNSPMVCDKVGLSPARVAHTGISDAGIKTGTPATNLQGAVVQAEAPLGMVNRRSKRDLAIFRSPVILAGWRPGFRKRKWLYHSVEAKNSSNNCAQIVLVPIGCREEYGLAFGILNLNRIAMGARLWHGA